MFTALGGGGGWGNTHTTDKIQSASHQKQISCLKIEKTAQIAQAVRKDTSLD